MKSPRFWAPALCLAAILLLALDPVRLDDFFLYITFGRRLFSLGSFGATDPFIFTIKDYHWDLWHEWLSYVVYFSTYSLGGYKGVIVLRALFVGAAAGIILRTCARGRLAPLTSVIVLAAAVYAASPRCFLDRASFFSDLFTLLVLMALTDSRFTARGGQLKWLLPGLFLLWVQLHPGYVIGWFLLGLFILSCWREWDFKDRREWVIVMVLSVLMTVLNPTGLDVIFWSIHKTFAGNWGVFNQIAEWTPSLSADFLNLPYKIFLVIYMAAVLLVTALNTRRNGWFLFAAAVTLSYLGISSARFLSLSGLGLGVLLAAGLARLNWSWAKAEFRFAGVLAMAIPALIIGILSVTQDRGLRFLIFGNPLHATVPVEALHFLNGLPPGNIFNEWDLGGFLAWELDGRQKIGAHGFISDPDLVMQHIYRFSVSREGWNEIILGGDVEYFFLRRQTFERSRDAAWIKELSGPDWRPVYQDRAAVIFQRNHGTL